MKVHKFGYTKVVSNQWVYTKSVVEDNSPLTKAVQEEANKHPTEPVVGISINDKICHVGPLEEPPQPDIVQE